MPDELSLFKAGVDTATRGLSSLNPSYKTNQWPLRVDARPDVLHNGQYGIDRIPRSIACRFADAPSRRPRSEPLSSAESETSFPVCVAQNPRDAVIPCHLYTLPLSNTSGRQLSARPGLHRSGGPRLLDQLRPPCSQYERPSSSVIYSSLRAQPPRPILPCNSDIATLTIAWRSPLQIIFGSKPAGPDALELSSAAAIPSISVRPASKGKLRSTPWKKRGVPPLVLRKKRHPRVRRE